MRLLGLAAAGASCALLAACSLLSLDGLTGGGGGWAEGGAARPDAPSEGAASEASGSGGSSGGGDAQGATDAGGPAPGDGAQDEPAPPDQDAPSLPPYRIVFVTSQLYGGNLGGVAGADAKCQALATAKGLPGTFLAWISDGTVSPASRMTHENLPYVLVDGHTQVASGWNALVSGTLDHAIDTTEQNTQVTAVPSCGPQQYLGLFVWTDTDDAGADWQGQTCTDWSTGASTTNGATGNATSTSYWTAWCIGVSCDTQAALYCVQQ